MALTLIKMNHNYERWSATAVAANATNSSDAIEVAPFNKVTVQVVHASHSDTSTWCVQATLDGTNYDTIAGSSTTTSGASGSASLTIVGTDYFKIRITITEADGGASSTLTPYFQMQRERG